MMNPWMILINSKHGTRKSKYNCGYRFYVSMSIQDLQKMYCLLVLNMVK